MLEEMESNHFLILSILFTFIFVVVLFKPFYKLCFSSHYFRMHVKRNLRPTEK